MMDYLLTGVIAYLVGSIPSGLILGRLFWHRDLRKYGSHNIGATNAWRTLGKVAGIIVFLADSLKGQAGVLLGLSLVGTPLAAVIGGLLAIVGHSFSLFLGFHGKCDPDRLCPLVYDCLYDTLCFSWLSCRRCHYTDSCRPVCISDGVYRVHGDCGTACHRPPP